MSMMMMMMMMMSMMSMMKMMMMIIHTGRDSLFPDHHLWPTIYQMATCQSTQHDSYDDDDYDDDDDSYDDDDDDDDDDNDDGNSNSDDNCNITEMSSHCRHTGVNINSSTPSTLIQH
jgi:hypothetical protein